MVLQGEDPVTAGGFSDIYKGTLRGENVCLKAIRIFQTADSEPILKVGLPSSVILALIFFLSKQRFAKEALLWRQLSHPNVLPIYGLYRFKNRICLVSPWMDAGDISTYLQHNPDADRLQLVCSYM